MFTLLRLKLERGTMKVETLAVAILGAIRVRHETEVFNGIQPCHRSRGGGSSQLVDGNLGSARFSEAFTVSDGWTVRNQELLASHVSSIGHQAKSAQGQGNCSTHNTHTASAFDTCSLLMCSNDKA